MSAVNKTYPLTKEVNKAVKELYEAYAKKLFAYTLKNYSISEDDAWTVVYKTIYKMAEVKDRYTFEHENKKASFIFKTHINFLRNHFRDNKSIENNLHEVEIDNELTGKDDSEPIPDTPQMKILRNELDKLEDWQRILLLMRGQDMPYSEISLFVDKPEDQLKVYYSRLKKTLLDTITYELQKINTTLNATK